MKFIKFFFLLYLFFLPIKSFGAIVYFNTEEYQFKREEEFKINFFINTEDQRLNSVKGVIEIPQSLDVLYINEGGSVINFWIEKPEIKDKKIFFAGSVPGGFNSSKAFVFSIVVKASVSGTKDVHISDIELFRDDGLGTRAIVRQEKFSVVILDSIFDSKKYVDYDKTPPEDFDPLIKKNPDLFDGDWFVVFNTQDKGVGIDHYEVKEGWFGDFEEAKSPHVLKKQTGEKIVFVKAIDKAGNENTAMVKGGLSLTKKIILTLALITVLFLIVFFTRKKFRVFR